MIIKASMSQAAQGCFLCVAWGLSPKPTVLEQQSGTLLNVAGAAPELKCTSGIFISLRDHHEKSFQWSSFCEEKSAVALFLLETAEEAHLQNIRKKWWGGGAQEHSIQPGQNLGLRWEDWSEGGRLVWMGPPAPWK